jgi:maltose alpha-D-glucosyltransferase/alpha-amylase
MRDGWIPMLSSREGRALEQQVLPIYLAQKRWFAAKDDRIEQTRIRGMNELTGSEGNLLVLQLDVSLAKSKETQRYLLPLALSWSEEAGNTNWPLTPYMIARLRRGPRMGAIARRPHRELRSGAAGGDAQRAALEGRTESSSSGRARPWPRPRSPRRPPAAPWGGADQQLDQHRRQGDAEDLSPAGGGRASRDRDEPLPDEAAGFAIRPSSAISNMSKPTARDGRSAWRRSSCAARARAGACRALSRPGLDAPAWSIRGRRAPTTERHAIYAEQMRILARRIAEMHQALAIDTEDPAFKRGNLTRRIWRLAPALPRDAEATFDALQAAQKTVSEAEVPILRDLLARRADCLETFKTLAEGPVTAMKTRIHGDLHLGQILVVQNDFYIIDFEASRPAASRSGAPRDRRCAMSRHAALLRLWQGRR